MDRCALFVDAGYVLADGAMAVHGTRRRESVSWDYAGMLQLLSGLARERSGLPLLRCYWYEATVEGRRTAEHDALADLPGVKLRLAKMRPGRREGVESEIHRDLTTLARNKAVSDAMVVSAEEDLGPVIADVQDLGMRVTLLHIAVENSDWTISRALRQECDDIVEISSAHLRPYVELISGAEPPRADERDSAPFAPPHLVNGNGRAAGSAPYPPAAQEADDARQAVPVAYPVPGVAAEPAAEPVALRAAAPQQETQPDTQPAASGAEPAQLEVFSEQDSGEDQDAAAPEPATPASLGYLAAPPDLAVVQPEQAQAQPPFGQEYAARPDWPAGPEVAARRPSYPAPVAVPAPPDEHSAGLPAARARPAADLSGYNPGAMREQPPRDATTREPRPGEPSGGLQPVPVAPAVAQVRRLPTRETGQPGTGSGRAATGMPAGGQAADLPPVFPAASVAPTSGHQIPAHVTPPQPASGQPGIAQPEFTQPGFAQPGFAQSPEAGQPLAGQPSAGHASAGQPSGGQPALGQPGGAQPGGAQPGGAQPGGAQSVAPVMPMAQGTGQAGHAGYAATRNGSYPASRPVVPAESGADVPASAGRAAVGGPAALGGQPMGPSGLVAPAGGQQAGPGGQPGHGFGGPNVPAPAGSPAGALNSLGQPVAYGQSAGGFGGTGGTGSPGGPLGPAGPAYSGGQPGVSLADAVQSAHQEGQEFGESVARDAPALWLEAVLARKPRMPSDLEARLLQGSALPIDFLLHDEVRHALRRGFWDALERARR